MLLAFSKKIMGNDRGTPFWLYVPFFLSTPFPIVMFESPHFSLQISTVLVAKDRKGQSISFRPFRAARSILLTRHATPTCAFTNVSIDALTVSMHYRLSCYASGIWLPQRPWLCCALPHNGTHKLRFDHKSSNKSRSSPFRKESCQVYRAEA